MHAAQAPFELVPQTWLYGLVPLAVGLVVVSVRQWWKLAHESRGPLRPGRGNRRWVTAPPNGGLPGLRGEGAGDDERDESGHGGMPRARA